MYSDKLHHTKGGAMGGDRQDVIRKTFTFTSFSDCDQEGNTNSLIRTCANKQNESKCEIWVPGGNGTDLVNGEGQYRQQ